MNGDPDLERRYRRLLAAYPAAFRREYEQEILSVLMAGAEQGQRWPRLAQAADLLRSATLRDCEPGGALHGHGSTGTGVSWSPYDFSAVSG